MATDLSLLHTAQTWINALHETRQELDRASADADDFISNRVPDNGNAGHESLALFQLVLVQSLVLNLVDAFLSQSPSA